MEGSLWKVVLKGPADGLQSRSAMAGEEDMQRWYVADVADTHRSGRQSLRLSARDLPPLECMGRTAKEGGGRGGAFHPSPSPRCTRGFRHY
jgi:hypothetical protein